MLDTRTLCAALTAFSLASPAVAQSVTRLCVEGATASQCQSVTSSFPLPVTNTPSATPTTVDLTRVLGTALSATNPVPVGPSVATTTHVGSTIAVTNTFQAALAASATRKGCMLQNNGGNAMYVFFGAIGSATTSNAVKLAAGQTVSCNAGNIVLTDAVNVTGTATDAYVVTSQ